MHSGEIILKTSQTKNAINDENNYGKDVCTMTKKGIRLDGLGNANDFDYRKKNSQNTSELIQKNLFRFRCSK